MRPSSECSLQTGFSTNDHRNHVINGCASQIGTLRSIPGDNEREHIPEAVLLSAKSYAAPGAGGARCWRSFLDGTLASGESTGSVSRSLPVDWGGLWLWQVSETQCLTEDIIADTSDSHSPARTSGFPCSILDKSPATFKSHSDAQESSHKMSLLTPTWVSRSQSYS